MDWKVRTGEGKLRKKMLKRECFNGRYLSNICMKVIMFQKLRIRFKVTIPVGYEWRIHWNEQGYNGLVPQFGGGQKSHLSEEEKKFEE